MRKAYNFKSLSIIATSALATASCQGAIRGTMHGGQQPIAGAHVYLLAPAKSTTLGTASVSLIQSGSGTGTDSIGVYVTTDANGDYTIPNFTCPAANVPVYLYSGGGNAGYGTNAAIAEFAYVSLCGVANSVSFVFIDEVTTVATAYATAGYATDPLHISYSGSQASLTGIANAFANSANLANMNQGTALYTIPSGYAQAPQKTVDTLADALAACVNQTSNGTNCQTLFNATNFNGVAPKDTATAVMNIAHAPASSTAPGTQNGTNITSIMTLSAAYQQFTPSLESTPNDLTLGLTFANNNNIASPTAVAIDGSGNAWIASQPSPSNNTAYSVVEIANPTSMQVNTVTYPVTYIPQTSEPDSIAVDGTSQNIWIGTDNAVEKFSTSGVSASGSPFLATNGSFGTGYALNLDAAGNVWIGATSAVYKLSATGSLLSPSGGYSLPAGAGPSALALDASTNVWVADYYNSALLELNSQGTQLQDFTPNTTNNFSYPNGVAIDAKQDVWVANNSNNDVSEYIPNGQPQFAFYQADAPPPYANPNLTFVAIDGSGNSWTSLISSSCSTNSDGTACLGVSEVSAAGQQLSGPGYSIVGNQQTNSPTANAVAIDGSGDVWVLNKFAASITELIGAAVPVVTPLVSAVSSNTLGTRP